MLQRMVLISDNKYINYIVIDYRNHHITDFGFTTIYNFKRHIVITIFKKNIVVLLNCRRICKL